MNARFGLAELGKLIENVESYEQKPDIPLIKKAFFFARKMHENQFRASKDPYFHHPMETAMILSGLNADSETIAAALLHDVIEDTDVPEKEIKKHFGGEVASLVGGVTKVDLISQRSREAKQIANLQKVLLATVSDVRVLFIKLADKLHNLRTIKFLPKAKQKEIAAYALEVYAPLAHKLGIHKLQLELEELCFSIVQPQEYALLKKEIEKRRKRKAPEIRELIVGFSKCCKTMRKNFSIYTIQKGVYNIFRKVAATGKSLDEIYDYTVVVVLVDSVRDCYECLGTIHSLFPPIARKLKDYIAIPQSNGYKSIHTSVIGPRGHPIKIYIRTKEMDTLAEKGMIVAKRLDKESARVFRKKMAWMRHTMDEAFSSKAGRRFLDSLKTDFLENTVFFFDKHGKIHELPYGAMPLDFAFHIGREQGLRFESARVNGKEVPLWYEIQGGDIVDVSFSKRFSANGQWLNFVKSKKAKKEIEKFLGKKPEKKQRQCNLHAVRVRIVARDKVGLFSELLKAFKDLRINIEEVSAKSSKADNTATVELKANFSDKQQIERIKGKLQKNKSVLKAQFG